MCRPVSRLYILLYWPIHIVPLLLECLISWFFALSYAFWNQLAVFPKTRGILIGIILNT